MKAVKISLFVFALGTPPPGFTQTTTEFPDSDVMLWGEEEQIYSATRYVKRLHEAPATATVIGAERIRQMGARNLTDVLRTVPGMGIVIGRSSAQGLRAIEVRGVVSFASEKVLVMIDGHRLNDTYTGGAAVDEINMPVEGIRRVEVIRGPGSALYGANAFVAVINVVTKDASDLNGGDLRAGAGNANTSHFNVNYGSRLNGWDMATRFNFYKSDGIKKWVESDILGNSGHTQDPHERYDLGLKLSRGEFSFNSLITTTHRGSYIGVGSALNDESQVETHRFFGEAVYTHSINRDSHLTSKAYYDYVKRDYWWEIWPENTPPYTEGMIGNPAYQSGTKGLELQWDLVPAPAHTITLGALHEHTRQYDVTHVVNFNPDNPLMPLPTLQDVSAWGNYNRNVSRNISALYVQDLWRLANTLEMTLGIRHDRYSDVGHSTNPRAALVWSFNPKGYLKLLYGTAFRAPSFEELYLAHNPITLGNEHLIPEEIETGEASLGYHFNRRLLAEFTLYHSKLKNLIDAQTTSRPFLNIGKVESRGIESQIQYNLDEANYAYANYTLVDARDPLKHERVQGIPRHRGNLGLNTALKPRINVNINLLMIGARPRTTADPRPPLGSYQVTNLTVVGQKYVADTDLRLSVYNLFDEEYADHDSTQTVAKDYPAAGRTFIAELRRQF